MVARGARIKRVRHRLGPGRAVRPPIFLQFKGLARVQASASLLSRDGRDARITGWHRSPKWMSHMPPDESISHGIEDCACARVMALGEDIFAGTREDPRVSAVPVSVQRKCGPARSHTSKIQDNVTSAHSRGC